MSNNRITEEKIVDKKVYNIGDKYAKGLQPAIDANEKWLQTFAPIKEAIFEYNDLEKKFKVAPGRKEFLALKQQEEVLRKKTADAIRAEQTALVAKQKVEQSIIDTERKSIQLSTQKNRAQQRSIKLSEQEKLELRILNRGKREAAVLSSKLSTEYEKQAVKLIQLRRRYKDLALTQGTSGKEAKKLRNDILKLDKALKGVDASVGQFQRNVGNYTKAMQSARAAARSLASAMGLVGGAFLVVQVVRDAIKVLRDFEKQNATLSAILQVERSEMRGLTDDAIRLGATTVKTAGQVTELQIAYARLGFSQRDILELTESTISGSIAMNSELDKTAGLVGAVVNTFDDLSTTDAPRIIDTLSLSTAKSALNFEKLEKGIPIVAGAANAAGIPFTKLVALLGKLSDAGIDVSTSSTALRNIFIESAAQGLNYEEILEKIKNSQDKLTASNDEFGKRAAVSAAILSKNIDTTNELDEALNKAAGTAERMANKELDTLDGSIKLLRSAWEGYILSLDESTSASVTLKDAIGFVATNLRQIIKVVTTGVKIWLLYKAAVLTARLQTTLINAQLSLTKLNSIAAAKGISSASVAFKKFTGVLKANALFLTVSALVALTTAFKRATKELSVLEEAQLSAAKSTSKQKSELESLVKVAKNDSINKNERLNAIKKINQISPEYLGNITLETINTKEATTALQNYIKELDRKALAQAIESKRQSLIDNLVEKDLASLEEYKSALENFGDNTIGKAFDVIFGEAKELDIKNREELENYLKSLDASEELINALRKNYEPLLKKKEEDIAKTKEQITALDEYLETQLKAGKVTLGVPGEAIDDADNLANATNKEISAIQQLRDKVSKLKDEIRVLTKDGYENLIQAQLDDIVAKRKSIRETQSQIDAILGVSSASKTAAKAEKDRAVAEKKLRTNAFKLEAFSLKQRIKTQQEIASNDKLSFDVRKKAIQEASKLEIELAFITAKNKFDTAKEFSDKEIEALLTKSKVSKDVLKKITDEELLIIKEFQSQKNEIEGKKNESEDNLDLEKLQTEAAIKKAQKEKELNDEIRLENEAFNRREGIYANSENAVEQRERRIAEIKKKYAIEALNVQVAAVEALLESEELSAEQRAQYEAKLSKLKTDISNLTTEHFIENDEKETLSTREKTEQILEISADLSNALTGLANSILDSKIQKIDEEIAKEDEKFDKLLENENLTEEERKNIEKQREASREKLEKKKAKEQRKQAILNKAAAAVEVGINTALAISKALAQGGFVLGIPMSTVVAALGAIQLAAVLAAPIPKFAMGTQDAPEGWAVVDENVPEVHTDKYGNVKSWGSDKGANLRYLEKGDKIYKSHDDYNRLLRASTLSSVEINNKKLNDFQAERAFEANNKELVEEMQLTRKAIEKNKSNVYVKQVKPLDFEHELFRLKNLGE